MDVKQQREIELSEEAYEQLVNAETMVDIAVSLCSRMWTGLRAENIPDEICETMLLDWFRSNFTDHYSK